MSNILLFGATGMQGAAVAQKLLSEGNKVISPVRSQEKVNQLKEQGLEGIESDFSLNSLTSIAEKAEKAIILVPAVIPTAEMLPFSETALQAVKNAGITRVVFNISSVIPDAKVGIPGPDTRLEMKETPFNILPEVTITNSTLYRENFSTAYRQGIVEQGMIPQAIPYEAPVAYMSMDDLGEYLYAILNDESFKGQYLALGGKDALSGKELEEQFSEILGEEIKYQALPPEALIQFLTPMIGQDLAAQVGEMYAWEGTTGKEKLNPDTKALQAKLKLNLPSFKEWAKTVF